ncbi:MAG: cupredoxin domain-containing protein [Bacteroidota bacterium]|nr:cupredoxin domain-containing protein [Bacteroidota bacterium]
MKDIYKKFLDAINIFSNPIRTWINSNITKNHKAIMTPVLVYARNSLVVAFFTFAFLACGDGRKTEQQRSSDMQTMGHTDEAVLNEREQSDTIPGVGVERVIELEAKDHVYFPREITAKPGEQFYVNLVNGGNEAHNIHVELPQAPITFGEPVAMGQSRKLLVKAPTQSGRYQIFCPVKDHRQRGMIATLIVE